LPISNNHISHKVASKPQIEASNPNINCWVMASAGSGKTKVLVDRFVLLLLAGVFPQEILCLTFTDKAAKEMEERISKKLEELAVASQADLIIKLENILGKTPSLAQCKKAQILFAEIIDCEHPIKIQTFHSFCKAILQLFPLEAKVPIHFEIIETQQERVIFENIWQEVLQDKQNHRLLADILAKTNSHTLQKILNSFMAKESSMLKDWQFNNNQPIAIQHIKQQLQKKFNISPNQTIEHFFITTKSNLDFTRFYQIIENNKDKKRFDKVYDFLQQEKINPQNFHQNFNQQHLEELYNLISTTEQTLYQNFQKIEDNFLVDIYEQLFDFIAMKSIFYDIKQTVLILELVFLMLQKYQQHKEKYNLLNFADLIFYTKQLLNGHFDWIKMKLDSNINHILLDEAQDTSPLQWEIVKALTEEFAVGESANTRPRSFFVVGDEKQSIYAFQGADIDNTSKQFTYFHNKLSLNTINLNYSFRSGKEILEAIDNTFEGNNLTSSLVKNTEYQKHLPTKTSQANIVLWQPLLTSKQIEKQDDSYQKNLLFAKKIAYQIKKWVAESRILPAKQRAIKYGDILLLFKEKKQASYLEKAFYEMKIPFAGIDKEYCLDSLLLADIIALAEFILNPENDYNLACLLKSPFCNQTEEVLQKLIFTSQDAKSSLWQVAKNMAELQFLHNFLSLFLQNNLFDFFYQVLKNPEINNSFVIRFGNKSSFLLDEFLFLLRNFINKNSSNLWQFLEYLHNINPEIAIKNQQENVVKMMTVHSAKGLQAPIVIIPYAIKQNDLVNKDDILWLTDQENHKEINIPLILKSHSYKNPGKAKKYLEQKKLNEQQENHRLLYVALTRAEDEIYLTGVKEFRKTESETGINWFELVKKANNLTEIELEELPADL
jgi:ATP-dependent helicase/nuclease subunit A